jgi:hypothetical protein
MIEYDVELDLDDMWSVVLLTHDTIAWCRRRHVTREQAERYGERVIVKLNAIQRRMK